MSNLPITRMARDGDITMTTCISAIISRLRAFRFRIAHALNIQRHIASSYAAYLWKYLKLRCLRRRLKKVNPDCAIIAIALTEHLGDIVAAEPIVRYIKQQRPSAYIIWCVKTPYRELIEHHPLIDYPLVVSCLAEWIRLSRQPIFDDIYDLHFQGRKCLTCNIAPAPFRGDPTITKENYFHVGNLLTIFCKNSGLSAIGDLPRIYIPESAIAAVDRLHFPEHFIAIHCLSYQPEKHWMPSKWRECVENILKSLRCSVVEVGLTSGLDEPVHGLRDAQYRNLCGQLSILETAEVIRRSQAFIGIDSGPSHLANAVGTYGIILLGNYAGFTRYNPYSGHYGDQTNAAFIYSAGVVAEIDVKRVYQALQERLSAIRNSGRESLRPSKRQTRYSSALNL